jgi:hypothetical protein
MMRTSHGTLIINVNVPETEDIAEKISLYFGVSYILTPLHDSSVI